MYGEVKYLYYIMNTIINRDTVMNECLMSFLRHSSGEPHAQLYVTTSHISVLYMWLEIKGEPILHMGNCYNILSFLHDTLTTTSTYLAFLQYFLEMFRKKIMFTRYSMNIDVYIMFVVSKG